MASKYCFISTTNSTWIVDSGATDHLCHDLSQFTSYTDAHGPGNFITIPDGTQVTVNHIGTVQLNSDIFLKYVLYEPGIKYNLNLIPMVCQDIKCSVVFSNDKCIL